MSKSTLDYPYNMCLSAFEDYESFKSSGGSVIVGCVVGGGGRIAMGKTVYCCIVIVLTKILYPNNTYHSCNKT